MKINNLTLFLLSVVIPFLLSCSKEVEFVEVKKNKVTADLRLPDNLIQELSQIFLDANPDLKVSVKKVKSSFGFMKRQEWPISLKIWPKAGEMPSAKDYTSIEGVIRVDLANFTTQLAKKHSQFYMSLNLKTPNFSKLNVFFLPSYSEEKKCSRILKITDLYKEKLSKTVLLSLKDDHYVRNYLGTYVFFSPINKGTYQLNIVQLTDSQKTKVLCPYF